MLIKGQLAAVRWSHDQYVLAEPLLVRLRVGSLVFLVAFALFFRKGKLLVPVQKRSSQPCSTQALRCPCSGCVQRCPMSWRWWLSWLDSRIQSWVPFPVRKPGKPGSIVMATLMKGGGEERRRRNERRRLKQGGDKGKGYNQDVK